MVGTYLGRLAYALGGVALTGCSLLYDPANLAAAAVDARPPVDTPTIVDPDALVLDNAGPTQLYEGQGEGGSRQAVLTIVGQNIADNATVELVPTDADAGLKLALDLAHLVRSPSGTGLAIPVTLAVDPDHGARDVKLTVRVSQTNALGAPIVKELAEAITVHNLDELTSAVSNPAMLAPLYSKVAVTAPMTFAANISVAAVAIRAVSSVVLGDIHVDASGTTPGVGGAVGGAKGLAGLGGGGGSPAALLGATLQVVVAASGGGYGEPGGSGTALLGAGSTVGGIANGDELLLAFPRGSSGGGGGGANAGGGGGGSLEITAGGTLQAGTITANGGTGGADGLLTGAAGGGSGGAVLLRAGATATITKIRVDGGIGGLHTFNPAAVGGTGGRGRVRFDVVKLAAMPDLPPAQRAGVTFAEATPLIVTAEAPSLTVTSAVGATTAMTDFDYYVFNVGNATVDAGQLRFVTATVVLTPQLAPGWNRVCITPRGRDPIRDVVLTSCTELAYVR